MPTREELLARAEKPAREAMALHPFYRGKIQMAPKCPVRSLRDFAIWYTPGVAAPCLAIHAQPDLVYEHTNKGNTIAVVSDGTRVLGLGNIGPRAALPVMEGKALLFKYLGGVDAIPLCLASEDTEQLIDTVRCLEPSFGGINLEDIAQPKCFRILDRLRKSMAIPVWHDDQQGSATVLVAGLTNALEIVRKRIDAVRIVLVGAGAAGVASFHLMKAAGIDPEALVACDSQGILHRGRDDIEQRQDEFVDKWRICTETNRARLTGGIEHALRGADACIAFSTPGPGIIDPRWIHAMARDAIVFACANPIPELWPWDAKEAGARIVATGRSDFPNQVNNSLGFPGIFRGVLDVRARTITDSMALAASSELAHFARERGIDEGNILPRMDEWEVYPRVAVATALAAQKAGVSRLALSSEHLSKMAYQSIRKARATTELLMREKIIEIQAPSSSP